MNVLILPILSNLCVAGVIAGIACVVGRSGRRAALAHLLWVAVFVKLITPPILIAPVEIPASWSYYVYQSAGSTSMHVALDDKATMTSDEIITTAQSEQGSAAQPPRGVRGDLSPATISAGGGIYGMHPLHYLVFIWATGTLLLFIKGVVRFIRFLRLIRREGVLDRRAMAMARRLVRHSRDRARRAAIPPVYRLVIRISPMLFGVGRWTAVICPDRLWQSLPADGRRAFLAHELAHYRRGDHWVRWLEWIVTSIYWWLPAVYFARRRLERHEEVACDAWALAHLKTPPRKYAETLLSVVDFISESPAATPRLASRMHAADSLEERLRWIMSPHPPKPLPRLHSILLLVGIASLLIVHPRLHPAGASAASLIAGAHTGEAVATSSIPQLDASALDSIGVASNSSADGAHAQTGSALPPVPEGWWTEQPEPTWASRVLGTDLTVRAVAGSGLAIGRGKRVFQFEAGEIRGAAFIPATGRLFLGNDRGEVHLWDATALRSVSLIGRHPASLTSLAFHPQAGLITGDQEGNLILWDPRSGEILGMASMGNILSSVRWSTDGRRLAVVTGHWSDGDHRQVHFIDGTTLQPEANHALPRATALVQPWPPRSQEHHAAQPAGTVWATVDWTGHIHSFTTGNLLAIIPKSDVSAAMLCQDFFEAGLVPPNRLHHD